jgi:hypothetical protein
VIHFCISILTKLDWWSGEDSVEPLELSECRWNVFVLDSFIDSFLASVELETVADLCTRAACKSGCDRLAKELRVRLERGGVAGPGEPCLDGGDVLLSAVCCVRDVDVVAVVFVDTDNTLAASSAHAAKPKAEVGPEDGPETLRLTFSSGCHVGNASVRAYSTVTLTGCRCRAAALVLPSSFLPLSPPWPWSNASIFLFGGHFH